MSKGALRLPDALAAQILLAAARAYPAECCGLLEGLEDTEGWSVTALHESANLAEEPARRFMIDPALQFALLHRLRGTNRRIVGCFHSHPGGHAEPSAEDARQAYETGFLYAIAGGAPETGFALAAYVWEGEAGFRALALPEECA